MEAQVQLSGNVGKRRSSTISLIFRFSLISLLLILMQGDSHVSHQEMNIISCIDVSSSMPADNASYVSISYFEAQIIHLESNQGGTFYVLGVTNSDMRILSFKVKKCSGLKWLMLSKQSKIQYQYKKHIFIKEISDEIVQKQFSTIKKFSYIERAVSKINVLLSQPNLANGNNYVHIHSDFVNHTPSSKPNVLSKSYFSQLTDKNALFFFSGLKTELEYDLKGINYLELTDFSQFTENY